MPVQRRSPIDDTEPTLKRHRFNTLRLLGKEDNFAVGSELVDNRRRWTNAKVTPIQQAAPAVGIMSGHCRKDVQTSNQDMVNRRAFCPAYTTRQKRRRGQCWASVCSAGQTPTQQMARVLCMPCHQYIIYYCNAEYYACKKLLLHNSNIIGFSCVCLSGLESQDQVFQILTLETSCRDLTNIMVRSQ